MWISNKLVSRRARSRIRKNSDQAELLQIQLRRLILNHHRRSGGQRFAAEKSRRYQRICVARGAYRDVDVIARLQRRDVRGTHGDLRPLNFPVLEDRIAVCLNCC